MSSWKEAAESFQALMHRIETGTQSIVGGSVEPSLTARIRAMMDTFPIGNPTQPHDLGMVSECLRLMYFVGFAAGAEHQLGDVCVHPVEGRD